MPLDRATQLHFLQKHALAKINDILDTYHQIGDIFLVREILLQSHPYKQRLANKCLKLISEYEIRAKEILNNAD